MSTSDTGHHITPRRIGWLSALLFPLSVFAMVCCDATASKGEDPVHSNHLLTQEEAVRSTLAEFVLRSPDLTLKSYVFEKLINILDPPPDLFTQGYFLCGHIAYEYAGKMYGPLRIVAVFSETKTLGLIFYDDPITGAPKASVLCDQVQAIDRKR
jgi:hypothetical protein